RGIARRQRQSRGLDQQPMQAADGEAGILDGAPDLRGAARSDRRRIVRQRGRRDLERVVVERAGERALPRERHRTEHLVAEREAHHARRTGKRRRSEPSAPPTTRFTVRLNRGTYISIVKIVIVASTAQIGRVKNGSRLPSDSTRPRRRLLSSRLPSSRPSTNGAIG